MQDATIVFDLDGTLVDTAPDLIAATNHAIEGVGLAPVNAAALRPWISFGARRMIVEAFKLAGHPATETEIDDRLAIFLTFYETNIAVHSRPFEHAIAALDTLQEAGAKLAICTNKREALSETLLRELELRDRFHALIGRDTLPVCKPDPEHLLGAIRACDGQSERAVMVGDSNVDIETAKAARVPVVAVTFGYSQVPVASLKPNALIDSYAQLLPALNRLLKC